MQAGQVERIPAPEVDRGVHAVIDHQGLQPAKLVTPVPRNSTTSPWGWVKLAMVSAPPPPA